MPFAYLRKMRAEEERQRLLSSRSSSSSFSSFSPSSAPVAGSPNRAIKIGLLAILIVPILLNLPWFHSALGPSGMRDLWVRPTSEASTIAASAARPECYPVSGEEDFKFCEDLHLIPGSEQETVLISCDANRAGWNTVMGPLNSPETRGGLFTYEYSTAAEQERGKAVKVELRGFASEREFHPLGFSLLGPSEGGGKGRRLFVVNHGKLRSSVEVFDLKQPEGGKGWEAHWFKSVVHPLATHTPNSIHAISHRLFVVTNDHLFARRPGPVDIHMAPFLSHVLFGSFNVEGWKSLLVESLAKVLHNRRVAAILAQIETLLGLPLGWVTLVELEEDGKARAKVIAKGIPFANGLVLTADAKTFVVAATTYPGVWMYDVVAPTPTSFYTSFPTSERFAWDSRLRLQTKLHLPFRVDNLAFASYPTTLNSTDIFSGHALLATGHPAPLKLIAMSRNPTKKTSPSWTISITPNPTSSKMGVGDEWEDKEVPLPAHHFLLSHNAQWRIRTLLQSTGETPSAGKEGEDEVNVASSASAFYRPYAGWDRGGKDGGLLMVSGLYCGLTACDNVGI
ncbi:uncharacterized protein UBRO_02420 [Ustilago bromivora]|uniref:Uncharacterized protein n=1 Tax=Ustilago bromivora TaxID=307758 RepID=A0A1K0H191_9BASI|nr:uncharacterized protein UBRO_02420 [Ustilago bromivora]SYW77830.1 uncharacterized protein UBRO2_02022 [Ustilago bromivora]